MSTNLIFLIIEDGFFHRAAEGVLANREDYCNMSPKTWRDLIITGRVTGAPDYIHIVVPRIESFLENFFFFDSFWHEPTVSYHRQVVGSLAGLTNVLSGYSDPPGYTPLYGKTVFRDFIPDKKFGNMALAAALPGKLVYPNGWNVPIGDTWMNKGRGAPGVEQKSYLMPAMGYAMLAGETNGRQPQLHVSFTDGKDQCHAHPDVLGITLFAEGREMISDIGYSHINISDWTTRSASHNVVVVDYKDQEKKNSRGNIEYMGAREQRTGG
ncbi:MAG: heparinase II/III family protein [Kiritimatiellae bacterium]|nr:heparinase II/III family protein [Kiritimatiellia bacterium]